MAVIKFRAQHLPILHGIATVFKAVTLQHFRKSIKALNNECGWHGYYEHNQILQSELEFRAVGTAEGDIRVLAIRLASELLMGRYQLPSPRDHNSPVARHEAALLTEAKHRLIEFGGMYRSEELNRNILPLSLPMIHAIGHRMAVEAAKEANMTSERLWDTFVSQLETFSGEAFLDIGASPAEANL